MKTRCVPQLLFMVVVAVNLVFWGAASLFGFDTNQSASVVVGQPGMTSNDQNQGGGPAANTLAWPNGAFCSNKRFFIAENRNSRVLIYNTIPAVNNASADVVVGQPNMTSNTRNTGGLGADTLNYPYSVCSDGTRLFIADTCNHRVLIYNTIPIANNASADVLVGQPNMVTNTANNGGLGANTLDGPFWVYSDGTKLFIADWNNHRVLIYNTIPTANNASADVVIGQPNMVTNTANTDGLGPNTLHHPESVYSDGTRLFIADCYNERVLIYNTIPTANNAGADVVVGQPNMFTNTANNGGLGPNTLDSPRGAYTDGTRLFISDKMNHRVLIYNTIPTANNASADVVIGQPNMFTNTANHGGLGPNTLNQPRAPYCSGTMLIIPDALNHRVLLYDEPFVPPTATPTAIPAEPLDLGFSFQIIHGLVRISRGESARMRIKLPRSSHARLRIYDITGRRIATLLDGPLSAGSHEILWEGGNAGSGTYLVYFEAEGRHARGKLVLVR